MGGRSPTIDDGSLLLAAQATVAAGARGMRRGVQDERQKPRTQSCQTPWETMSFATRMIFCIFPSLAPPKTQGTTCFLHFDLPEMCSVITVLVTPFGSLLASLDPPLGSFGGPLAPLWVRFVFS